MFILIQLSGGRCGIAEKWSTRHTSYKWHEELMTRPFFLVKSTHPFIIYNLGYNTSANHISKCAAHGTPNKANYGSIFAKKKKKRGKCSTSN